MKLDVYVRGVGMLPHAPSGASAPHKAAAR